MGKLINLPTNWDEISLRSYMALTQVDYTSPMKAVPQVLKALSVDDGPLYGMKMNEVMELSDSLKFVEEHPTGPPQMEVAGQTFREFRPGFPRLLQLCEFIDLDILIKRGVNDNLHQIVAVLYSDDKEYNLTSRRLRAEKMLDAPFGKVWSAVRDFIEHRNELLKSNKGLFRTADTDSPFYNEKEEKNYQADTFTEKWGWYVFINRLAGDDVTKHDNVLSMRHIEAINQLAFFADRDEYQRNKQMKE
jgi:hypothetical protein